MPAPVPVPRRRRRLLHCSSCLPREAARRDGGSRAGSPRAEPGRLPSPCRPRRRRRCTPPRAPAATARVSAPCPPPCRGHAAGHPAREEGGGDPEVPRGDGRRQKTSPRVAVSSRWRSGLEGRGKERWDELEARAVGGQTGISARDGHCTLLLHFLIYRIKEAPPSPDLLQPLCPSGNLGRGLVAQPLGSGCWGSGGECLLRPAGLLLLLLLARRSGVLCSCASCESELLSPSVKSVFAVLKGTQRVTSAALKPGAEEDLALRDSRCERGSLGATAPGLCGGHPCSAEK